MARSGGSPGAGVGRVGQRHPELDAVQAVVPGVETSSGDAVPAGHQVQLAGPDHRVHADAVAVLDLAGEQPADGLQAGVRVRGHVHPAGVGDVVGAVVVGEAPGADQRAGALGQRAAHRHRARTAERHIAAGEHLDPPVPGASSRPDSRVPPGSASMLLM